MGAYFVDILRTNWQGFSHCADKRSLRDAGRVSVRARLAMAVFATVASFVAAAANHPIELVSPRAAGTAPAAGLAVMPSGHRIFKAHPGLPYNIRAVVTGGAYPFEFSLSGAPAGMTINVVTGEINWPSPTGATVTPTIRVTDSEGTQVSSPWTIAVTTEGFKFVSPSGNDANVGTLDAPWRTMLKVHTSSVSSDVIYWRAGTYTPAGIPRTSIGSPWERAEFGSTKSAQWLAYPGERAVINFGYVAGADPGAMLRFQASPTYPVYLDGLEAYNFRNIGFQIISGASDHTILRRLTMHQMVQGVDGENPSAVMWTSSYSDSTDYCAVQDSEFYSLNGGGALKFYSQNRIVVENNIFRDSSYGFDLKAHVPRFDVRANTFQSISSYVLFGNMNTSGSGEPASGEIRFNNINTPAGSWTLDINQDGQAAEIYIYRNTLVGHVRVRNVDAADGVFRFRNNVIVNNDSGTPSGSHVLFESVADPSRIVITDNLVGSSSSGIVDSAGALTSEFIRYLGTHGHQLGTPSGRPNPPTNVTAE